MVINNGLVELMKAKTDEPSVLGTVGTFIELLLSRCNTHSADCEVEMLAMAEVSLHCP